MTIDRRLRVAAHELREVEVSVPSRAPRPAVAMSPALVLPVLMVVFGAAIALAGVGRVPASVEIGDAAVAQVAIADVAVGESTAVAPGGDTDAPPLDDAYDVESELRLIRALRSSNGGAASTPPVAALPDARTELEVIESLAGRPPIATPVTESPRPITGLI